MHQKNFPFQIEQYFIDFSSNFCNRENLPCMQYVNASQFISENHGNPERILANTGSSGMDRILDILSFNYVNMHTY